MKNKIFYCIFLIIFPSLVLSNEFEFNASEIESYNNGNMIKGFGGVQINDGLGLTITGEKFEFDKLKSLLKVTEKVIIRDKLNKDLIKSNQIIYNKKLNIITSKDKTIIELNTGHIIESSDITFNRNLNSLFANESTLITDLNNNKLSMSNFSYSTMDKILVADEVKINDNGGNVYDAENVRYDIEKNQILGKDLSLSFNEDSLKKNTNEPRLKGNAFVYKDNLTQINKGIFTTCKKNDKCPPWVLSSEKIEHDKVKKVITYENALLRVYNIPVFYFPRFFHPDPTVDRQSGFLIPRFSQSSNFGNYISTPYFNAVSQSSDLTFSPRFYGDGKAIYQGEYRNYKKKSKHIVDFSIKNKSALVFDNKDGTATHFFLKSIFDLDLNNFDEAKVDLKIQRTSNDNYLKNYKLKTPLIDSENDLHSSIDFDVSREDLQVKITAEAYENLNLPDNDRYEYVFPSLSILKNLGDFKKGALTLNSNGLNKQFNTNTHERMLVNDLSYKSYNKINTFGLVSSYEVLLKNFNMKSKKSIIYKNKTENTLQSIVNYEMKYPLEKIGENFLSTLTPILSVRYSPNKSKNKSLTDRSIGLTDIFAINRIGFTDTVEGGQSITIGNEYALYSSKDDNKKIFSADLATSIRDIKNNKLPINSTLGKKNSDIFGNVNFNANKFIDFDYNFALDNNLETLNFNQIKSTLSFYNFVSTFDFIEKNNFIASESYISNESKLQINDNSSFSFKTRKNKEKNLTEYYNLMYEYKNDCLVAGIEFKKDFYDDGSMKPEEQLFFSITIMPLGNFNTPDINQ